GSTPRASPIASRWSSVKARLPDMRSLMEARLMPIWSASAPCRTSALPIAARISAATEGRERGEFMRVTLVQISEAHKHVRRSVNSFYVSLSDIRTGALRCCHERATDQRVLSGLLATPTRLHGRGRHRPSRRGEVPRPVSRVRLGAHEREAATRYRPHR